MAWFLEKFFSALIFVGVIGLLALFPLLIHSILHEGQTYKAACEKKGGETVWNGRYRECWTKE